MIRMVIGGFLLLVGLLSFLDTHQTASVRAQVGGILTAAALLLIYFGYRARRRKRRQGVSLDHAARKGSPELVQRLIDSGADIHKGNEQALHDACLRGRLEVVKLLVRSGANVNVVNALHTPLMMATSGKNPEVLRLLIHHGAQVNARREDGNTALFDAVRAGSAEMVRDLLKAGANANAKHEEGYTPIYLAAGNLMFKQPDIAVELLEAGVRMEGTYVVRKWYGALDKQHPEKWEVNRSMRDGGGNTLLMIAAWSGRANAVKRLRSEVPIDSTNKQGQTALMLAAMNGHRDIVVDLLESRADVFIKDREGRTAAALAGGKGHIDIVELLQPARG